MFFLQQPQVTEAVFSRWPLLFFVFRYGLVHLPYQLVHDGVTILLSPAGNRNPAEVEGVIMKGNLLPDQFLGHFVAVALEGETGGLVHLALLLPEESAGYLLRVYKTQERITPGETGGGGTAGAPVYPVVVTFLQPGPEELIEFCKGGYGC